MCILKSCRDTGWIAQRECGLASHPAHRGELTFGSGRLAVIPCPRCEAGRLRRAEGGVPSDRERDAALSRAC